MTTKQWNKWNQGLGKYMQDILKENESSIEKQITVRNVCPIKSERDLLAIIHKLRIYWRQPWFDLISKLF